MFTLLKSYQKLDGEEAVDAQEYTCRRDDTSGIRQLLQTRIAIFAHLLILTLWVIVAVIVFDGRKCHCEVDLSYSPARNEWFLETRTLNNSGMPGPPYAGKPNESKDAAWRELETNAFLRVTEQELDEIDPSQKLNAVKLPDGDYLGTLEVYHEIHCLKHLRQFLYFAHYFPKLSDRQATDLRIHLDHCLEVLRGGVMCRADISPLIFIWDLQVSKPLLNFTTISTCVNWEKLDGWAARRQDPRLLEPGYLRHAVFGPVLKHGNNQGNHLKNLIPVAHAGE